MTFIEKLLREELLNHNSHQMGMRGDMNACKKTPLEVNMLVKETYKKKKWEKGSYMNGLNDHQDEK